MKEERCYEVFICNNCKKEMENYDYAVYFNKDNLMINEVQINFCDDFHFCSEKCMREWIDVIFNRCQIVKSYNGELNLQGFQ